MAGKDSVFKEEQNHLTAVQARMAAHIDFLVANPNFASSSFAAGLYGDVARANDPNGNKRELGEFYMLVASPYMGRMDFNTIDSQGGSQIIDTYIGERNVYLENQFVVYDWRTPVGQRFYLKNEVNFTHNSYKYETLLRRALFVKDGVLEAYDTEYIRSDYKGGKCVEGSGSTLEDSVTEPFLVRILKEKRNQRELTPIIISMQEEQNNINRMPPSTDLVVQGCAGSGKTMVLLHRLSYLKFNNPDLQWERVKIITPNEMFNTHINALSQRLELSRVERITVESYYARIAAEYEEHTLTLMQIPLKEKNRLRRKIRELADKGGSRILSEIGVSKELLSLIYSDNFGEKLEQAYKQVFKEFEEHVAYHHIDRINEPFGFNKNVSFSDDTYKKIDVYLQTIKGIESATSTVGEQLEIRTSRITTFKAANQRDTQYIKAAVEARDALKEDIVARGQAMVAKNVEAQEPNTLEALSRINYASENLEWHFHLLGVPHTELQGSYKGVSGYNDDIASIKNRIARRCDDISELEGECQAFREKGLSPEDTRILAEAKEWLMGFSLEGMFKNSLKIALGDQSPAFEKISRVERYRFYLYVKCLFYYLLYGKVRTGDRLLAVDEGQDLSPCEYNLFRLVNGAVCFNIYGDTNQLIKSGGGTSNWQRLKKLVDYKEFQLNINYRNTRQIADYCNEKLSMNNAAVGTMGQAVAELPLAELLEQLQQGVKGDLRVAIIYKDTRQVSALKKLEHISQGEIVSGKIPLLTPEQAKGLEFDRVYVLPSSMSQKEQYIAYTRALAELIVAL